MHTTCQSSKCHMILTVHDESCILRVLSYSWTTPHKTLKIESSHSTAIE